MSLENEETQEIGLRAGWPAWRWPGFQACCALASTLLGYDVSNVANIQAPIYHAFGQIEKLTWVAIGYTALNVCMAPLCRRLSMIGDLKVQFYLYTIVFITGAAVAGAAQSMNAIIVGRAITGVGGAGLYQGIMLYNFAFSTPVEASKGQAVIGVSFAIGLILGPIVGGAFAENSVTTWRWAMYINIPVLFILLAGWIVFLPPLITAHQPFASSRLHTWKDIDWLGWFLHSVSFVMLFSSLIFSGSYWPWNSKSAIVAWTFTACSFLAYISQQFFCVLTSPGLRIIPVRALSGRRSVVLVAVSTAMAAATYGITLYYTPLFFSFTRSSSPIRSAVEMLPFIGAFIGTNILASASLPRLKLYPAYYVLGGALMAVGGSLQSQVSAADPNALVVGRLAIIGGGVGLVFQQGATILKALCQGNTNKESDCITMFLLMQLGGVALFMSIAGCIFQNRGFEMAKSALLAHDTRYISVQTQEIRQAMAGLSSNLLSKADPSLRTEVTKAVTDAIGEVFYIVVGCGAMIILCGFTMKWERLDFDEGRRNEDFDL